MALYLAVDLGTTGCRSILFDENMGAVASDYREYGLITPRETWVEQDAQLWWSLTLQTAKAAIEKAGVSGSEIRGISVSSQGITVVPVDRDITPLCNALTWLDTRAQEEAEQLRRDFGEDTVYRLTGKPVSAVYTLPKLLWLKKYCPEIFNSTWKFLMPMEFLVAKFTGNCITDHSMASGTLLYDLKNGCWSEQLLKHYKIPEAALPRIAWGGEVAGCVLAEVAQELGLRPDCVVAVGAQDQKCAAYGVGLDEGVMTVSLGTAAAITKRWNTARTEDNQGVGWCGYVEKDTYVTEGVINTAGTCLRWVRDMLFPGEGYDVINAEAKQAFQRGSSLLFHPFLAGADAPHYYAGSTGSFYGVSLATTRGDFALAVMEGVAFQIRVILEAMQAYGNVHSLVLFGGGANSDVWASVIANVTGMKICIPQNTEAAGAGAARLAAKAAGAQLAPLTADREYLPEHAQMYEEKYKKYRDLEKKIWA